MTNTIDTGSTPFSPAPDAGADARSDRPDGPDQLVGALHAAFGEHHARAAHAKGLLVTGTFVAAAGARALCRAPIFDGGRTQVLARFSNFGGLPDIADNDPGASPHGFGLKLQHASGTMDVVAHSFDGFPVATAVEFRQLLLALAASGPDRALPTPLDLFLQDHPRAKTFLTSQKPPPVSYATLPYFGVNAFRFTNDRNQSTAIRHRFVPAAGEKYLEPAARAKKSPDYLATELAERLAAAPIAFTWLAQIAAPGDALEDPSEAWPAERRLVELGQVSLTHVLPDQGAAGYQTMFLPTRLPVGIEPIDPMVKLSGPAYLRSFELRR